ncbi:MAG: type II toxin-antitoxin system mRNA interferase toxin, RelE/StbE family [Candidatus Firestonebacteria bacterium]
MQSDKIKQIHFSPRFLKSFNNLPKFTQKLADTKDEIFRKNPFDIKLHTHMLKGELNGIWSYSVNYNYRVLFRFIKNDEVLYYDIGTHEIYR